MQRSFANSERLENLGKPFKVIVPILPLAQWFTTGARNPWVSWKAVPRSTGVPPISELDL